MRVLAVGAHPDDIELGCGGTLLAHRARGDEVTLLVMTTGERGPQDAKSRIREQEDAVALLGAGLLWGGFQDGAVDEGRDAVTVVQDAVAKVGPDLIYAHAPDDTHQDHRATARAVLSAARRMRQVLLYESPTSTQFSPSIYVNVAAFIEAKMDLLRAHMSQVLKNGLVDLEALEAQARYHGFRARLRYAEAFATDRFLWDIAPPSQPAQEPAIDRVLLRQA
jgi:LmbE family N-acetylglucosaminyl deacetylase